MALVGHLLILAGFLGLILGVVTLIHPIQQMRIPTRKVAGIVAGVSLAVMILGGAISPRLQPVTSSTEVTSAASADQTPTPAPGRTRRIRPVRLVGRVAIGIGHLITGGR